MKKSEQLFQASDRENSEARELVFLEGWVTNGGLDTSQYGSEYCWGSEVFIRKAPDWRNCSHHLMAFLLHAVFGAVSVPVLCRPFPLVVVMS